MCVCVEGGGGVEWLSYAPLSVFHSDVALTRLDAPCCGERARC